MVGLIPQNPLDHGVTESGAFDAATHAALIDSTTHINETQGKTLEHPRARIKFE